MVTTERSKRTHPCQAMGIKFVFYSNYKHLEVFTSKAVMGKLFKEGAKGKEKKTLGGPI